mgnify:CR=1 FL=1
MRYLTVGGIFMENHGLKYHSNSTKKDSESKGVFRTTFRKMAPLISAGFMAFGTASANALEMTGFGQMNGSRIENNSGYATTQSREGGITLNTNSTKDYYGKAKLYYFNNRREAKLSDLESIVTEHMVLQQSISIMRTGDTLNLAPMSFKMTGILQNGNDYTANFDITDTGTGEVSSVGINIGSNSEFPWKDNLYVIETEGDNLLASPQTVYVRVFRAQEKSSVKQASLYPSISDEGIGASLHFGTKQDRKYGAELGTQLKMQDRRYAVAADAGIGSSSGETDSKRMAIPGFTASAWFGGLSGSYEQDKETIIERIEFKLKRLNFVLKSFREKIDEDIVAWKQDVKSGLMEINVFKESDGAIDLAFGGEISKINVSASGAYEDRFNSIELNRGGEFKSKSALIGLKLKKRLIAVDLEGAINGKNNRWAVKAARRF